MHAHPHHHQLDIVDDGIRFQFGMCNNTTTITTARMNATDVALLLSTQIHSAPIRHTDRRRNFHCSRACGVVLMQWWKKKKTPTTSNHSHKTRPNEWIIFIFFRTKEFIVAICNKLIVRCVCLLPPTLCIQANSTNWNTVGRTDCICAATNGRTYDYDKYMQKFVCAVIKIFHTLFCCCFWSAKKQIASVLPTSIIRTRTHFVQIPYSSEMDWEMRNMPLSAFALNNISINGTGRPGGRGNNKHKKYSTT